MFSSSDQKGLRKSSYGTSRHRGKMNTVSTGGGGGGARSMSKKKDFDDEVMSFFF